MQLEHVVAVGVSSRVDEMEKLDLVEALVQVVLVIFDDLQAHRLGFLWREQRAAKDREGGKREAVSSRRRARARAQTRGERREPTPRRAQPHLVVGCQVLALNGGRKGRLAQKLLDLEAARHNHVAFGYEVFVHLEASLERRVDHSVGAHATQDSGEGR